MTYVRRQWISRRCLTSDRAYGERWIPIGAKFRLKPFLYGRVEWKNREQRRSRHRFLDLEGFAGRLIDVAHDIMGIDQKDTEWERRPGSDP